MWKADQIACCSTDWNKLELTDRWGRRAVFADWNDQLQRCLRQQLVREEIVTSSPTPLQRFGKTKAVLGCYDAPIAYQFMTFLQYPPKLRPEIFNFQFDYNIARGAT